MAPPVLTDDKSQAPKVMLAGWDWSEASPPWAYASASAWESKLPAGVPVVPLSTVAGDFYTKLQATVNAASGRVIVRLPAGVFTLNQFRAVGSSGNPTYAFGFFFPKLAGFVGAGPDQSIIEMAAGSVSQAQLSHMSTMTQASFIQLLMGMCRLDTQYSNAPAPIYLGGVGFEAAPQPLLTAISSDITGGVYVPQPAPHLGVVIYSDSSRRHPDSRVTHCRFRGAGKAMTSQPPFELSNITSQRNHVTYEHTEFDGRMSPRYDAARPRKCGVFMANGGVTQHVTDCWMHHCNVSRYAANDESVASATALSNHYRLERLKIEQITNNQNRQPPLNGGNSLGGYTNASCIGFESSNALIEIVDCIASVDNNLIAGQVPCHIQLTNTGAARAGGRLYVRGGEFRHTAFTQLNGFVTFRIQPSSNWWTDGFNTTLDVRDGADKRLLPHQVTGTWPPTAAALASAGVTPATHFLIRST
ncbi:hypothetical protein [Corallococcus carmarthensis]|nr:hypothetical protein [Corallococcus carmarthensis]